MKEAQNYIHYSAQSCFTPLRLARGFTEKNYSKCMHTQGFYEINIVLRGSAVHRLGEREITVSKGDTFIIPPYVPHGYEGGEGFDVYHILLSPKFLAKNSAELQLLPAFSSLFKIDPMMREKTTARLHFCLTDEELALLAPSLTELADRSAHSGSGYAILANCEALSLIVRLCEVYEKRNATAADDGDEAFHRSVAYIYENYSRHINISELVDIARMSRSAYMVKFKRVTGCSPGKFQTQCRVELAKQLLLNTDAPVSQIATEVGCCDASHLVRIFSAETQMTPSRFRDANKKK